MLLARADRLLQEVGKAENEIMRRRQMQVPFLVILMLILYIGIDMLCLNIIRDRILLLLLGPTATARQAQAVLSVPSGQLHPWLALPLHAPDLHQNRAAQACASCETCVRACMCALACGGCARACVRTRECAGLRLHECVRTCARARVYTVACSGDTRLCLCAS